MNDCIYRRHSIILLDVSQPLWLHLWIGVNPTYTMSNDNRLENLRILCPNCHTQTPTFSGKHRKKTKFCVDCGVTVSNYSTRCNKCASIAYGKTIRRFEISKENLENLIRKNPMTTVGKMLGVSDNAIRARCRKLGIELKSGLWGSNSLHQLGRLGHNQYTKPA